MADREIGVPGGRSRKAHRQESVLLERVFGWISASLSSGRSLTIGPAPLHARQRPPYGLSRKRITVDQIDGFLMRLKALPIDAAQDRPLEILERPGLARFQPPAGLLRAVIGERCGDHGDIAEKPHPCKMVEDGNECREKNEGFFAPLRMTALSGLLSLGLW
jgi:hypothetical protein